MYPCLILIFFQVEITAPPDDNESFTPPLPPSSFTALLPAPDNGGSGMSNISEDMTSDGGEASMSSISDTEMVPRRPQFKSPAENSSPSNIPLPQQEPLAATTTEAAQHTTLPQGNSGEQTAFIL